MFKKLRIQFIDFAFLGVNKWIIYILILVILILGLPSFGRAIYNLVRLDHIVDFRQFYLSGYIWRVAADKSFYDPEVYTYYSKQLGIIPALPGYPPIIAIIFYPMSLIPYDIAKLIWIGINILSTLIVMIWAYFICVDSNRLFSYVVIIMCVFLLPATTSSLLLGQITPLIGLGLMTFITLATKTKSIVQFFASVLLGLLAAIKLWPILLIGYFVLRKKYLLSILSLFIFLLLTITSALITGMDKSIHYFMAQLPVNSSNSTMSVDVVNQSIWSVNRRLFIGGTTFRSRLSVENTDEIIITPLVKSKFLYWLMTIGYITIVGLIIIRMTYIIPTNTKDIEILGFWTYIVFIMTILPFSWDHYSYFILFPIIYMVSSWRTEVNKIGTIAGLISLTICLLGRYWAWLPPWAVLMMFIFIAEIAVNVSSLKSINIYLSDTII